MPGDKGHAEDFGFKASAAADDLQTKNDGMMLKAKAGFPGRRTSLPDVSGQLQAKYRGLLETGETMQKNTGIATASYASGDSRGGVAAPASGLRWRYLIMGIVCMIMIANLQYGWTLFVLPLHNAHGWAVADIQVAFALFIALETWPTPIDGWIADTLGPDWGPRTVMGAGGILVAIGWIIEAHAGTLSLLYLGAVLTGLGAGAVYTTAVGNAAKWFRDRRGLAVGLTAAGFGAGTALTIIPIRLVMGSAGYASTFFWFGLIQGGIVLIVSQFIRAPRPGEAPVVSQVKVRQSTHNHSTKEMVTKPVFWVLYLLFLLMAAGGLMAAANLAAIAKSYHVANIAVIAGASTLSVGLIFANLMNGVARPFFGWVSDHIGHSHTMAIAFGLGACAYFLMAQIGDAIRGDLSSSPA